MSIKNGQNQDQVPVMNFSYSKTNQEKKYDIESEKKTRKITLIISSILLFSFILLSILFLSYSLVNGLNNKQGYASTNGYSSFGLFSVSLLAIFTILYYSCKFLQNYIFNKNEKIIKILNIISISFFYLILTATSLCLYSIPLRTRILSNPKVNVSFNIGLTFTIISLFFLIVMVLLNILLKKKHEDKLKIINLIVPFILVWMPTFVYPIYSMHKASLDRGAYMLIIFAVLADISIAIPNKKKDDKKIDYVTFIKDIILFSTISTFAMCIYSYGILNIAYVA